MGRADSDYQSQTVIQISESEYPPGCISASSDDFGLTGFYLNFNTEGDASCGTTYDYDDENEYVYDCICQECNKYNFLNGELPILSIKQYTIQVYISYNFFVFISG